MDARQLIIREVAALSSHYLVATKSPGEQARWLSDFADDLGEIGAEPVVAACQQYRRSDAKRMPTPGQLRKLAFDHKPTNATGPGAIAALPWAPISDEQYDALGLQEKVNHQTNLAHQAKMKAGPMWKNGRPAGPDELTETWHHWRGVAKNHEAEAKRLWEIIKSAQHRRENAG